MPYEHHIDEQQHLAYTVLHGRVSGAQIVAALEALAADGQLQPGFDLLWDASRVGEIVIDPKDSANIRRVSEEGSASWGPGKTAIIAPRDVVFWIAKLFEAIIDIPGREIRAFATREEALAWLGRTDLPTPLAARS